MKTINFNSNQFSYLSNEVKLAMDKANLISINQMPNSFGTDLKVTTEIELARNYVADSLKLKAHEVFFGYGSLISEIEIINNSILFLGVENIITSRFENTRKLEYLSKLNETSKIKLYFVETSEFGEIDISSFQNLLSQIQIKSLISLSHANLYTGILLPMKEISGLCKKNKAFFHLDLSLTIGRYSIELQNIKPDFVSFDSSLLHGPVGIGIQILSDKIELENPIYHTIVNNFKNSENKNLAQILGFHKAYSIALGQLNESRQKISKLKNYIIEKLKSLSTINLFSLENKKVGLINLIPLFIDKNIFGEYIIEKLDLNGVYIQPLIYPICLDIYNHYHFINIAINEDIIEEDIDYFFGIIKNF